MSSVSKAASVFALQCPSLLAIAGAIATGELTFLGAGVVMALFSIIGLALVLSC